MNRAVIKWRYRTHRLTNVTVIKKYADILSCQTAFCLFLGTQRFAFKTVSFETRKNIFNALRAPEILQSYYKEHKLDAQVILHGELTQIFQSKKNLKNTSIKEIFANFYFCAICGPLKCDQHKLQLFDKSLQIIAYVIENETYFIQPPNVWGPEQRNLFKKLVLAKNVDHFAKIYNNFHHHTAYRYGPFKSLESGKTSFARTSLVESSIRAIRNTVVVNTSLKPGHMLVPEHMLKRSLMSDENGVLALVKRDPVNSSMSIDSHYLTSHDSLDSVIHFSPWKTKPFNCDMDGDEICCMPLQKTATVPSFNTAMALAELRKHSVCEKILTGYRTDLFMRPKIAFTDHHDLLVYSDKRLLSDPLWRSVLYLCNGKFDSAKKMVLGLWATTHRSEGDAFIELVCELSKTFIIPNIGTKDLRETIGKGLLAEYALAQAKISKDHLTKFSSETKRKYTGVDTFLNEAFENANNYVKGNLETRLAGFTNINNNFKFDAVNASFNDLIYGDESILENVFNCALGSMVMYNSDVIKYHILKIIK